MIFKKLIFVFSLLSVCFITNAQIKVYGLQKDYTQRHIRKNRANPFVYSVVSKTLITEKKTSIKQKSPEYSSLKQKIYNIENNLNQTQNDFQLLVNKYDSLNIAINNINSFIKSLKPIRTERKKLIESQKIITHFNIDELIYADESFNTKYDAKFIVLSSNHLNLRLHLREVVKKILKINTKPEKPNIANILPTLKNKLKNTPTHITVDGPIKKIKKRKLSLDKKIIDIPSELNGNFIIINDYSIIAKDYSSEYKKGVLIKKSEINRLGIKNTAFVKKPYKILIKNTSTNKFYIVDNDFLLKYAYTFDGKYRYQVKEKLTTMYYQINLKTNI